MCIEKSLYWHITQQILGHYEEKTLSLTKHHFDKWYFKIFFPIQGQVFLSWSDYLHDWVFLIQEKLWFNTIVSVSVRHHSNGPISETLWSVNTIQLVNMSQIRDASIPSIMVYLSF